MDYNEHVNDTSMTLSVTAVFVLALLALAVFQSNALLSLSYDFPPSLWSERLVAMAEQWHGWMQAIGAAGVSEAIAETLDNAHGRVITD